MTEETLTAIIAAILVAGNRDSHAVLLRNDEQEMAVHVTAARTLIRVVNDKRVR